MRAVKSFDPGGAKRIVACDVLVAGGGTGGVAAALSCASQGLKVCLTEETDWLGGQMTSQGVSALDENYLVESCGATRSYQRLRTAIRDHYRRNYKLSSEVEADPYLNPGNCWVSRLAFEPLVGLDKIQAMLKPLIETGVLEVFLRCKPVRAQLSGARIKSCSMVNLDDGALLEFRARMYLDTTELGDLLPLVNANYVSGAESFARTGEPHAPRKANRDNVQDFVYPFVVEFRPGEVHTIARPAHYDRFKQAGKFSFLGYKMFARATLDTGGEARTLDPFWEYRRLIDRGKFIDCPFEHDVAMINWESNDLRGMNIIDKPVAAVAENLALAKALSLGFLYWMQTEAPRDDGGSGYPELALRPDVLATADGLSKYPYIRESRRIRALTTVREQDIAATPGTSARARSFADSVGIGLYPIDIHGHQDIPGAAQSARPFQIPLGALIPERPANLLAAAKNIGTTHITNGSYRLHPVEWAIGEAAGRLAAYCLKRHITPRRVWKNARRVRALQCELVLQGTPVYWYDDVPTNHPAFAAIQFLAITGIMNGDREHLHFRPDDPVAEDDVGQILARLGRLEPAGHAVFPSAAGVLTRAEFAMWVYHLAGTEKDLSRA